MARGRCATSGKEGGRVESVSFDDLARSLGEGLSRRRLARVAGGGALVAAAAPARDEAPGAEAKQRRKKRAEAEHNIRGNKAIMCINGETRRVPKKKRKKYLKQGATRGKCQDGCTPVCPAGTCNIDDGCGGTCPGCPGGQLCVDGVCQVCTISCDVSTETPSMCGDKIRAALKTGGDLYICPGVYEGTFTPAVNVAIHGAGNGADGATSTILTGSDSVQIMEIRSPITVLLSGLRFANGLAAFGGGIYMFDKAANVTVTDCVFVDGGGKEGAGIFATQGTMAITDCQFLNNKVVPVESDGYGAGLYVYSAAVTVSDSIFSGNHAGGASARGGAIYLYDASSSTTVTGCTITNNSAEADGGGIASSEGPITITDTTITDNTAGLTGGGIYSDAGIVTLAASVSITGNTAQDAEPSGGGVYIAAGGTLNRNGATISGNTPDQCVGTGC